MLIKIIFILFTKWAQGEGLGGRGSRALGVRWGWWWEGGGNWFWGVSERVSGVQGASVSGEGGFRRGSGGVASLSRKRTAKKT